MRMRQQLTAELQQVQRMLSFVNPNETQLIDTLRAQQAELAKQINDVSQQLQVFGTPSTGEVPPDSTFSGGMLPLPSAREVEMPNMPRLTDPTLMPSSVPQFLPFQSAQSQFPPYYQSSQQPFYPGMPVGQTPIVPDFPPMFPGPQPGNDQDQSWTTSSWGPKPPKELTEIKQSVESLRKEIAELKETIKVLETQIQLLNRNVLLSEKTKE